MRYSILFAAIAFGLFGLSLALPSVDFAIMGKAEPVPGFMIVYIALGFGVSAIGNMASGAGAPSGSGQFFLAAFAATFNALFLALPVLLFKRALSRRGLDTSCMLVVIGMGTGAATPFAFAGDVRGIESGFCVWLAGYFMLALAILAARREVNARP